MKIFIVSVEGIVFVELLKAFYGNIVFDAVLCNYLRDLHSIDLATCVKLVEKTKLFEKYISQILFKMDENNYYFPSNSISKKN